MVKGYILQRGLLCKIQIAGARTRSVERRLWQIACQWVWNLRLTLGKTMQGAELREMEWAPPKEAPPFLVVEETPPEEYGPWQWAASFGRATGRFGAEAFTLQENGRLRCPAGASLWLSEVRQENAFTRARCLPGLPDRLSAVFPAGAVPGERRPKEIGRAASVRCAVSCLHLPLLRESPSCSER